MKNTLFTLLCFITTFSFSQDKGKLLFALKINAKQIEKKANLSNDDFSSDLTRNTGKFSADVIDELCDISRGLENVLRTPSVYGIDYKSYNLFGSVKEGNLSTVIVLDLNNYEAFKEGLLAEDLAADFLEKDGLIEVYENKVFTDKKKLVIVNTESLSYRGYNAPKLVNSKEDALDTKYMKCTEDEYARQIAVPIEERDFDTEEYKPYGFCGDWYNGANIHYNNSNPVIENKELGQVKDAANEVEEAVVESVEPEYDYIKEGAVNVVEEAAEVDGPALDEAADAVEAVSATSDAAVEYAGEIEGDKQGYYIEYYRDYILIENRALALQFFQGNKLSATRSYLKFTMSNADQAFWLDNEQLLTIYQELMANSFMGVSYGSMSGIIQQMGFIKGNSTYGELFFNNGVANLTVHSYGNEEFLSKAKKLYKARINKNLLKFLPADVPVYLGGAVDINEFYSQYDEYIQPILKAIPEYDTLAVESYELFKLLIDKDAVNNLFTGQVLSYADGYYDFEKYYTDYTYDDNYNYVKKDTMKIERRPSVYNFFGTKDNESWLRVARMIEQSGYAKKEKGVYTVYDRSKKFSSYREPREVGFYFTVIDDAVVMGTDKIGLTKILSGATGSGPSKVQKKNFKKYSSYASIDFGKSSDYLFNSGWIEGSEPLKVVNEMKQYESMEVKGMQFSKDYVSASMRIEGKNESVNILEQFINSAKFVSGQ